MILVESPDGAEMCLVEATSGYDGWTVLAEGLSKPQKWERWNGQAFAEDPEERQRQEDRANASDPVYLLQQIADLEVRVAEVEGKLANQLPV